MLTNFDLENEAYKYNLPLIGIFNKDQLPSGLPKNGYYIINLQDDYDVHGNDLPGTHWTVFVVEGKHAAYFDSYGFPPPIEVQNYLRPFLPYPYNRQQVQSMRSTVCGKYVLFFMMFMSSHKGIRMKPRFEKFMSIWSPDVSQNRDRLLKLLSYTK